MSGIFGYWNATGEPLPHPSLLACLDHLGYRDSQSTHWSDGSIAIGGTTSIGRGSAEVLSHSSDGATCVFDGRLDNRDELLRTLDGDPLVRPDCPDAQLAVAAYRRFGDAFVEHLDGDFSVAVFDSRLNRLVVARDRLGIRPVCYTRTGNTFLFASNAKAILAVPGVPAVPDAATLADFVLAFLPADTATRTFFEGVHSLPAAHFLVVTPAALTVHRYFDFDTGSGSDSPPGLTTSMRSTSCSPPPCATGCEVPLPVAVTVSGGLDSAYVFCVAHGLVRQGVARCPDVLGFNYEGPPGSPSDEREFVTALEAACGVPIARIPQQRGFMQAAELSVWHTESPTIESLTCQAQSGMRRMREAGAGRLLTGHWGDQVLFDSDYLLDLLRSGQWRLLQQHLRGWGLSAPRLATRVGRTIAAGHLPPRFKLAFRRVRRGGEGDPWRAPWFTPRFRRVLRDRAACARLPIPPGTSHAAAIYRQSRMGYHVHCMEWNNRTAGSHELDIAFPYLDCALLQFLMSIPGDIQSRDGVPRGLMRAAMRRVVPQAIVDRRCKGEFTQLTNETIEHDFDAIATLLGPSASCVQLGYVDGTVLRNRSENGAAPWALPAILSSPIVSSSSAGSSFSCAGSLRSA